MRACSGEHIYASGSYFYRPISTEMGILSFAYRNHNSIKTLTKLWTLCSQQIETEIDHQFNALHDKYCETMRSSIKLCVL